MFGCDENATKLILATLDFAKKYIFKQQWNKGQSIAQRNTLVSNRILAKSLQLNH